MHDWSSCETSMLGNSFYSKSKSKIKQSKTRKKNWNKSNNERSKERFFLLRYIFCRLERKENHCLSSVQRTNVPTYARTTKMVCSERKKKEWQNLLYLIDVRWCEKFYYQSWPDQFRYCAWLLIILLYSPLFLSCSLHFLLYIMFAGE